MQGIFTIPEAIEWLSERTGTAWRESAFYDEVCKLRLTLRAAPPQGVQTEIRNTSGALRDYGEGFQAVAMGWRLAVLQPAQVFEVWQAGAVEVTRAIDGTGAEGEIEELEKLGTVGGKAERYCFTKPVRITREMVRVTLWTLKHMRDANQKVEDATAAADGAPATDTAASAKGADVFAEPAKAVAVRAEWVMKKAALIKKHAATWPTIDRDFRGASENGLSKAAKAPAHGEWVEAAALAWADQRGKRETEKRPGAANSVFAIKGTKHKTAN